MSSSKKIKQDSAASQGPSDQAHLKMAPRIVTVSPESLVRGDEDLIIRGSALEGEVEILFFEQRLQAGRTVKAHSENDRELSIKAPDLSQGIWTLRVKGGGGMSNIFAISVALQEFPSSIAPEKTSPASSPRRVSSSDQKSGMRREKARGSILKDMSKTVKLPDKIWREISHMAIERGVSKHVLVWTILSEYTTREKARGAQT